MRPANGQREHALKTENVMLARDWHWADSPAGWMLSEKFDGIRALWNGRALISREGSELSAPAWFLAQLPAGRMLDGELWIDRRHNHAHVDAITSRAAGEGWRQITFQVFDLPAEPGTFAHRLNVLRGLKLAGANVRIVEHVACSGIAHFDRLFDLIVSDGGEGLMLRRPSGRYVFARSAEVLKAKPFAA